MTTSWEDKIRTALDDHHALSNIGDRDGCTCGWKSPRLPLNVNHHREHLVVAAVAPLLAGAVAEERAAVVAWLREHIQPQVEGATDGGVVFVAHELLLELADDLERGEHLPTTPAEPQHGPGQQVDSAP